MSRGCDRDVSGNLTGGVTLTSPMIFTPMTQVQIIFSPVEVVFNTDTKKLQIYTENRESFTINNRFLLVVILESIWILL